MKINWKRFAVLFCLFEVMFVLAGCTASWLGAVSALLPAAEVAVSAIVSFVFALEGKTVPASVVAEIQKIGNTISAEVQQVQQLIAQFKASGGTGILAEIQAVLQGVVSSLSNILSGLGVTDSSTLNKITQLVGLSVAAFQAILALIPLAMAKIQSGASQAELHAEDKIATKAMNNAHKTLQETYVEILAEKTTNADVNAALDSLPKSLP